MGRGGLREGGGLINFLPLKKWGGGGAKKRIYSMVKNDNFQIT